MKALVEWLRCPFCGNKTRDRIREDTVLINFPLYCPKCRQLKTITAKKTTSSNHQSAGRFRRRADEVMSYYAHLSPALSIYGRDAALKGGDLK